MAVEEKKVIQTPKVRKEEISHVAPAILATQDIPASQTTPVAQENQMIQTKNMIQTNHMVLTTQEGQITLKALNTQNIHAVQESLRTTKVARIIKAKANHRSKTLLENYLGLSL